MPDLDISLAASEERGIFENLIQLYTHDFSELWGGKPQGELDGDGRFAPYGPLDLYWSEEGRIPLLIRKEGRLAGFALLNTIGHTGAAVDRNMAEFFVVRKHRRGGVGTAAVKAIFDRYPGLWEVAVVRSNVNALAFWQRAIVAHRGLRDLEKHDVRSESWDGPIFRFRIEA